MQFSQFWSKLPEDFNDLQKLHEKVRSGEYGNLTLSSARAAYLDALGDAGSEPFSDALLELMNNRVAVNRILWYIDDEFSCYRDQMQKQFIAHTDICPDFSDAREVENITNRLSREWLESIDVEVCDGGKIITKTIDKLAALELQKRYTEFWRIMLDVLEHKKVCGCDIKVMKIDFNF